MAANETKSFDPHERVDLTNSDQLKTLGKALDATPEEIGDAVEKVGDHPRAVAIFLGKGAAL